MTPTLGRAVANADSNAPSPRSDANRRHAFTKSLDTPRDTFYSSSNGEDAPRARWQDLLGNIQ